MLVPNWLATLAGIILVIAMPVVLVASPLYLFVRPAFVRHEYSQRGFPPADRFADAERLRLSDTILHYLRGSQDRHALASMRTDGGEIALAASEVQHLVDVKGVMDAAFIAHGVATILQTVCLVLLCYSSRRQALPLRLRQGVWLTAALIGFVAVSALTNFSLFFTRFHQIFFSEGTWIFDPSDTLIQLYPLPFWVDTVWKIALATTLELGLVYIVSIALARWPWLQEA